MESLVTVRTFVNRLEAEIARGLLEAHGVACMVLADDCGGLRPYLLIGVGGARLQVRTADAGRAAELLETAYPIPAAPPEADRDQLPLPDRSPEAPAPEPPAGRVAPRRRRSFWSR